MRRLSGRRAARQETGEYLIDGPVLLADAIDAGVSIDRVYVEPDAVGHPVVERAAKVAEIRPVTEGSLGRVLDVVTPNGMVAVARMEPRPVGTIVDDAMGSGAPVLVMIDVADPGNLGTLMRSAEASGAGGVVVMGTSTDPHGPKAVRAAAGSLFRVPLAMVADPLDGIGQLMRAGIRVWATVRHGGLNPERADLTRPCAIVIGNEAHGLSDRVVGACGGELTIPMAGAIESLNAAMAGTVIMFEAARQRRSA